MLKLPADIQIFVATGHVDMRKQAHGLSAVVMGTLNKEPTSGHLFIFFNRTRDRIRMLFWDRDGYCVVSKCLERGRFRKLDVGESESSMLINGDELAQLLSGVQLPKGRKKTPVLH